MDVINVLREQCRISDSSVENAAVVYSTRTVIVKGESKEVRCVRLSDESRNYNIEWVLDDQFDSCMKCGASFGIFTRRHHCRLCGLLVCDGCSSKSVGIPSLHLASKSCEDCFLTTKAESESYRSENNENAVKGDNSAVEETQPSEQSVPHVEGSAENEETPVDEKVLVVNREEDCSAEVETVPVESEVAQNEGVMTDEVAAVDVQSSPAQGETPAVGEVAAETESTFVTEETTVDADEPAEETVTESTAAVVERDAEETAVENTVDAEEDAKEPVVEETTVDADEDAKETVVEETTIDAVSSESAEPTAELAEKDEELNQEDKGGDESEKSSKSKSKKKGNAHTHARMHKHNNKK